MGLEDIDRVDVGVHDLDNSTKALSNISTSAVSDPVDDDFAKGYVDPKEERAFVSQLLHCAVRARQLTDWKVWKLDLWFLTIGFLGYMFKYIDQTNIVRETINVIILGLLCAEQRIRLWDEGRFEALRQ